MSICGKKLMLKKKASAENELMLEMSLCFKKHLLKKML